MMWTRHQLAPAVPMQKVVDRAVAGRMTDGFLVSRLEIMDVQHFAGAGRFGKTRQQRLFFGHRHVLVLASTIWPGLERLDTTVVIGHVSAVHRTQRHAHRSRNRRLRHPALTQQHHLDALALRRRHLPSQRSLQPPYLGLAAFDHPFPRIRWSKRITPQARNTARPGSLLHYPNRTDSRRYGAGNKHRVLGFEPQLRLEWRGPGRPERNRTARSFRQLRRFYHIINSDKVFGTHRLLPRG